MIARLTRRLLAIEFGALLLVATGLHYGLHCAWGSGIGSGLLILIVVRLAITLNSFALAWRYQSVTPDERRLKLFQMLRLFFGEFHASIWSSSWAMPFLEFASEALPPGKGLPVVLVHGYGCNSGYWHRMRKTLDAAGIAYRAVNLEPVFADIEDYVPIIEHAIDATCRESGHKQVIVLAHSMGGLATRAYLRRHGTARIARLITLGSPHHGTGIANFGAGMNCRQMHWRGNAKSGAPSPWLRKLDESEDAALRALIVSIYSHHDNIVAPQISSHLEGARNIEFHGIGHVELALHPLIQQQALAEIRAAQGEPAVNPGYADALPI